MTIPGVTEEIREFLYIVLEQDQRRISRVHSHVVFLESNLKLVKKNIYIYVGMYGKGADKTPQIHSILEGRGQRVKGRGHIHRSSLSVTVCKYHLK